MADSLAVQCHELCAELAEHVKLLRDYAHNPKDIWLAKAELAKSRQILSELESLLDEMKSR